MKSAQMWLWVVRKYGYWYPKVVLDIEPIDEVEREIFLKYLADEVQMKKVIELIKIEYDRD